MLLYFELLFVLLYLVLEVFPYFLHFCVLLQLHLVLKLLILRRVLLFHLIKLNLAVLLLINHFLLKLIPLVLELLFKLDFCMLQQVQKLLLLLLRLFVQLIVSLLQN